jgi:hypothetical protein
MARFIEVLETAHADGTHAVVVGGKREARIAPVAAKVIPGHYTNSVKMSRPNYTTPDLSLPAGFLVSCGATTRRLVKYDDAVQLAVWHAGRAA